MQYEKRRVKNMLVFSIVKIVLWFSINYGIHILPKFLRFKFNKHVRSFDLLNDIIRGTCINVLFTMAL